MGKNIFFACLPILFLAACVIEDTPETRRALIDQKLRIKLEDYESKRYKVCFRDVVDEAEQYVDSLLLNELETYAVEEPNFPSKPIRPAYEKKDSVHLGSKEIKPLWDSIPQ